MNIVRTAVKLYNAVGTIINPATSDNQTNGNQITKLNDCDDNPICTNYPLAVDGDSVYVKDIDLDNSDIGTFTGTIASLFNSTQNEITDTSATNPKTFTLIFNRPISTSSIRITSKTSNFSNIKIFFKTVAGNTIYTIDDSTNNTKYTNRLYKIIPETFDTIVIEFHTTDEVKIANITIPKTQSRTIAGIEGFESIVNSTNTPLGIDGVFTGTAEKIVNYGTIVISVYSDVASATDGLDIQQSVDGTNWDFFDKFTIEAATGKTFSVQGAGTYLRIIYTNGSTGQSTLRLQTQFKPVYVKPSSHRLNDVITGEDDAELVKAGLTAKSLITSLFENISSYRAALNVNNAWVNRKIVNETFHQHSGTITNPTTGFSAGDKSGTVDSVVGFAVGEDIKLEETVAGVGVQEIGLLRITDITGSVITWDRPIANDYTTAATLEEATSNMNVSGTLASPQIFEIDPPVGTIWQFTRILLSITDQTVMDDAKFGGITALTNGVSLRATTEAGRTVIFGNWKTNSDMKLDMYDIEYSDKAPAGFYGLNGRWTFTRAEVVAELNGDASPVQKLEILIQDDLTDLDTFIIRGQGRVFSP